MISLLNAIFNGNPVVTSVKFLNAEPQKDDFYSKASRLDIEAEIDGGTIVNIELQCVDNGDLGSRSIVYASKLIAQHTKQGQSYKDPKVISIWIIRNKVTHGPMANRMCPIDEATMCLKPNQCVNVIHKIINRSVLINIQN